MERADIDWQCEETAIRLGLPVAWVIHHVQAMAGRRPTEAAFLSALTWVEANLDYVRVLGAKREANRPKVLHAREMRRSIASER